MGFLTPCGLLSLVLTEHGSASGRAPAFPGGCQLLTLALPGKEFVFPNHTNKSTDPTSPCPEIDHRPVVGGEVFQGKVRAQNQSPHLLV